MRTRQGLYRLGPFTRWLRQTLNRAAPSGLHPVVIAGGELEGFRLLLDLQVDKDLWLGTYEPEIQQVIREVVRPGMTAYDLGANIGYVTLLLARAVGERGKVVAVEPLASNVERLREAVRLNRLENRVVVVPKAISAGRGRGRFLVHASPGMGRLDQAPGRSEGYEGAVEVEIVSMDELVEKDGLPVPDVVKVDVEGAEGLALEGMRGILHKTAPILLVEVHNAKAGRVVWSQLTSAGYALFDLGRGRRVESPAALESKVQLLARLP